MLWYGSYHAKNCSPCSEFTGGTSLPWRNAGSWAFVLRFFFSQASSSPASSDEDKKSDEANDSDEDLKSDEAKDGEAQQDNKDDEAQDEPSDSQRTNFYEADFTGR